MASIRRGYSDDFTLNNNPSGFRKVASSSVGIGTSVGQEVLDVVDGSVKGQDLKVTGISSFTAYEGFLRADHQIAENTTLSFDQGPSASLSGEIIVGTGVTVTVERVGLGTTVVAVGSGTTVNTIDTTDFTRAGGSEIECLKVYNTFTPPSGGTNDRPYAPKPGELYYNYDFKTIEFFDGYGWRQVDYTTRSGRAVFGGGYIDGNTRTIDMQLINIPTLGNATYFGDLARDLSTDGRGVGSAVRGIVGGGYGKQTPGGSVGRLDDMDYFTIASEGNAIDFGNLTVERNGLGAVSSSTRGIFCGGAAPSPATNSVNTMDYIQISTTGNALDFGDLVKEKSASGCLVNSPTRGIVGAGDDYSNPAWQHTALGHLDAVTMSSKGNAVDFGTDAVSRIQGGACGNAVRGCFAGGYASTLYTSGAAQREAARAMTVISISTFGNSVEFGTLSSGPRIYLGAASSNTRGIWTGGSNYPVHFNEIEYTQFASLGDSIDFGDLTQNKGYMQAATSDSHGGLGGF